MRKTIITCDLQKPGCLNVVEVAAADVYASSAEATAIILTGDAGNTLARVDACSVCRAELLKFLGK